MQGLGVGAGLSPKHFTVQTMRLTFGEEFNITAM